jgi:nicotinamide riboside kinase
MSKVKKLIVSLMGGPGSGKTTAATELFNAIKKRHVPADLVTDFAKDMIIQKNTSAMENQLYIWASQLYRNRCAYKEAVVTVTDTPVLLGCIYNTPLSPHLKNVILEEYHKFNNYNLIVSRDVSREFQMFGRVHDEAQSIRIDQQIIELLDEHDIPFSYYDESNLSDIVDEIVSLVT